MKRVCALLICLSLAMPSAFAAGEGTWPDWAQEAMSWGQSLSISQEFLNAPEEVVTRGAAAQLLYEAAGRPAADGECPFSDVSGDTADAITWAAEQGFVTGVGNGRYEPSRPVARQEFAAILWRQS